MKPFKAVILGSENYHAIGLAKDLLQGYLPSVELIGMYGEDDASNQMMRDMGVPNVGKDPFAFVKEANLVLVTTRHGDTHLPLVRPYMQPGNIIWVDKPLAIKETDFASLLKEAETAGAILWGSSFLPKAKAFAPLISGVKQPGDLGKLCGGMIASPVRREAEFGGFFFYTQHLVEIAIGIFGKEIKEVFATEAPNGYSVILRYADFDVSGVYHEGTFHYDASACFEGGTLHGHVTPTDVSTMHQVVLDEIAFAIKEDKAPLTHAEMELPFRLLHKLYDSLQSGKFETVDN